MGPIPINVARSSTSHVFGLDRHQRRAELQHDPILATSKQSADMAAIGIIGFILSLTVTVSLRRLFPRNVVPLVSTSFEEAVTLLERAEAINIPDVSEYRANLAILRPQFLQMRTESHRSPGFFQQFYLLFLCGLTWRLYHLKSQVDAIRRRIELAVDEHQLAFHTNANA